jgi:hypothetical protein
VNSMFEPIIQAPLGIPSRVFELIQKRNALFAQKNCHKGWLPSLPTVVEDKGCQESNKVERKIHTP